MGNTDSRHLARLLAVQYLFTLLKKDKFDTASEDVIPFEPNSLLNVVGEKKFNTKLYEALVTGVLELAEAIDKIIEEVAPAWPIDQINPVDLTVLRVAIWEAFISQMTPPKVVINEAINIDKYLSSKDSSSFVNGVLGKIFSNPTLQDKLSKLNKNEDFRG